MYPCNTVIKADSRDLGFLPAEIVDLTVTSPPYRNAIDYDLHLSGQYFRGKRGN
jgi:DNA modification methylase